MDSTFRIGKTNHYVKAGDIVWTDLMECFSATVHTRPLVVTRPIRGQVRHDGTVMLVDGKIVRLETCRICEKRIDV